MKTIETVIDVAANGEATLKVPPEIAPGRHPAVVLIGEQPPTPAIEAEWDFPIHDLGPWPEDLSLRREDMYGDDGR